MSTQAILKDYQAVRAALTGTDMRLPALAANIYHLKTSCIVLNAVEDVYARLDGFNPQAGWLGYQSGNQYFNQQPLVLKNDHGLLLNAELAGAQQTSLHVRYNGRDGWIVTQYDYPQSNGSNGDNEYIADRVVHLASHNELGTLNYLRFWQAAPAEDNSRLGINPVVACFTGFGD